MSLNMKDLFDTAAVSSAFAVYLSWLPDIAATVALIYTLVRIYEWARFRIFGKQDKAP